MCYPAVRTWRSLRQLAPNNKEERGANPCSAKKNKAEERRLIDASYFKDEPLADIVGAASRLDKTEAISKLENTRTSHSTSRTVPITLAACRLQGFEPLSMWRFTKCIIP